MRNGGIWTGRLESVSRWLAPILALGLWLAWAFCPQGASEEYRYTVKQLFYWLFPLFLLLSLFCWRRRLAGLLLPFGRLLFKKGGASIDALFFCAGVALLAIPFFSPPSASLHWLIAYLFSACWLLGAFCLFTAFFRLAIRLDNYVSGILCLAGSLALAFALGEVYFLLTSQYHDGLWLDSAHSAYVLRGEAQTSLKLEDNGIGEFPLQPAHPSHAFAQRFMKFGRELFDVRYTFDAKGRRILPPAPAKPEAELLLFGCSFTFGHGLEDDQTWAWLLAQDLGPGWKLENYAYDGFGAQQMLALLEAKKIDAPTAPRRYALFLALYYHLRRNEGFLTGGPATVRYTLEGGRLRRAEGSSPWAFIPALPKYLNGSQLADEFSTRLSIWLEARNEKEYARTYAAMLVESARILRESYGTELKVLIWPGFEFIMPELEAAGIDCLEAKAMLKDWDKKGPKSYQIAPELETHPNARAARELAAGLAEYFRRLEAGE